MGKVQIPVHEVTTIEAPEGTTIDDLTTVQEMVSDCHGYVLDKGYCTFCWERANAIKLDF